LPGVLREEAERNVVERSVGSADALDVGGGNAESVSLQRSGAGNHEFSTGAGAIVRTAGKADAIRQAERGSGERAEVGDAAEVQFEDLLSTGGAQQDDVDIGAEFEGVAPFRPGDVVGELETLLHAVDRGVRLAAEVRVAGNIDAQFRAAGKIREAEMVAAASELETEFIEDCVAGDGGVLERFVDIVQPVHAHARPRVLPEDLVLPRGLNPSGIRRSDAYTQERIVLRVPHVIET